MLERVVPSTVPPQQPNVADQPLQLDLPRPPRPKHVEPFAPTPLTVDRPKKNPTTNVGLPPYTNPALTTPLFSDVKSDDRLLVASYTADLHDNHDEDSELSSSTLHDTCRLSPRGEHEQPYPRSDREQRYVKRAKQFPNRIVMKRSEADGGVIFFIPTQINQFLEKLFATFADAETGLLSETQFEKMLTTSRVLPGLLPNARSNIQTSQRRYPTPQRPRRTARVCGTGLCPPQRLTKVVHCVFRHRDNPSGTPIAYGKFLRVLHRVARYRYRKYNIRDDEAVNALVAALARSRVVTPAAPKREPVDAQTETIPVSTKSQFTMTSLPPQPEVKKPAEAQPAMTPSQPAVKPPETPATKLPKKIPAKLPETIPKKILEKAAVKPLLKQPKKTPQKVPKTVPLEKPKVLPPKRVFSRAKFNLAEQLALPEPETPIRAESTTTASSVVEAREAEWLEKKAYEVFRLYADNKRGEIPLMTWQGFYAIITDCGLADIFDLDDIAALYYETSENSDVGNLEGITFLDFKDIIQEIGDDYNESGSDMDEDDVYYQMLRSFFLPLLYHCDNGVDTDVLRAFHVVDDLGRVLQPDNITVAEDAFLGPDGKVVNAKGEVLPGDVYTLDGRLVEGPIVGYSYDKTDGTIKDREGRSIPGYRVLMGPDDTVLDHLTVAPSGCIAPIRPETLRMTEQHGILDSINHSQKDDASVQKKEPVPNEHIATATYSSPTSSINTSAYKRLPVEPKAEEKKSVAPVTIPETSPKRKQDPQKFVPDIAGTQLQKPIDYPLAQFPIPMLPTFPAPIGWTYPITVPQSTQPPHFMGGRFVPSPYVVNYEGLIVRESDEEVLYGFTAGPNDTVIGPDGRPVCNARIAVDGRRIDIIAAPHEPPLETPDYIKNFPARWETESSEDEMPLYRHREPISEVFKHYRDPTNDIGLSGGPKIDIYRRLKGRNKKPTFSYMRTESDDDHTTDDERGATAQDAAIEGYVWPPFRSEFPPGFVTPKFN